MSKKELIKNIAGIVISVLVIILCRNFIAEHSYIPKFFFWLCLEVFAFMDGSAIYNMFTCSPAEG